MEFRNEQGRSQVQLGSEEAASLRNPSSLDQFGMTEGLENEGTAARRAAATSLAQDCRKACGGYHGGDGQPSRAGRQDGETGTG
jgi:hypothetical protein